MTLIKTICFGLGVILIGSFVCADGKGLSKKDDADLLYSVEQLRADFFQMKASLEEMHPALYQFTNRETFKEIFDRGIKSIVSPMGLLAFNKIVSYVFSFIGCGHSIVVVPMEFRRSSPDRLFPLKLLFIEGKPIVSEVYHLEKKIPRGSEILLVNGESMAKVIDNLTSIMSSDGNRTTNKLAQLNDKFFIYYMFYYYFPKKYSIDFINPGGRIVKTVDLEPIGKEELKRHRKYQEVLSESKKNFDLEFNSGLDTAILTIKTFQYYGDRKKAFFDFLDQSFLEIKKRRIKYLVLDLRGNFGGDPFCANHLLSYIERKPVVYFSKEYEGYRQLSKPTPLSKDHFLGKIFTLIDKAGFSTTGHIAALLKYHKIGTLVGSETGSTFKCHDNTKKVKLTNTGLELYIATQTYSVSVDGLSDKSGIKPDIHLMQSVKDYLNQRDTVIDYVLETISRKKN